MCRNNCNIKQKKWKQLTWENRLIIEHMYNVQKKNYTQISKEICVHRTTISREIKNGLIELETSYKPLLKYSADVAQRKNTLNETAKGPMLKIGKDINLAEYIEEEIRDKKSPEVIAYRILIKDEYSTKIHWKTIYNYIDKGIINVKRNDLTYGMYKKKHNKRKTESIIMKNFKQGKTIHDRPEHISNRGEIGHWEMDLVEGINGKKDPYLLVLSERMTRKEIIRIIPNKTNQSVVKVLDQIERQIGVKKFRNIFKTITTDNGTEFRNWKGIEQSYCRSKINRTTQYFADSYSSWQRGTNENINKMIRRFLPKGTSFKNLTQEHVQRIESWINNYPRKILNFKSSQEYYKENIA